jgi:hypothetical protein
MAGSYENGYEYSNYIKFLNTYLTQEHESFTLLQLR